jgi:hypothetical protein
LVVGLATLACTGSGTPEAPAPGGSVLRPASELVTDCYDFPRRQFTRANHPEVGVRLESGQPAVDFTLQDTRGKSVRLGDLLAEKPVLLVQGSWTCPRFQEERPGLEQLQSRYGQDLHIVHVYNVEAHPQGREPSPYHGRPAPQDFSDRGQARNYEERLRSARDIDRDSNLTVLVDAYDAGSANPVWCTYGTCASCSWLIAQDGTIWAHHEWHDTPSMTTSIEALLASKQ